MYCISIYFWVASFGGFFLAHFKFQSKVKTVLMLQGRIWSHLEASFTSPFVSLLTFGSITRTRAFWIVKNSTWIRLGLMRPLRPNGPRVYRRVHQPSGVRSLRYPERWWDVPKTNSAVPEPGKCSVFRQSLPRLEIPCQYQSLYLPVESNSVSGYSASFQLHS